MKSIQRGLFLVIFLFSAGVFSSTYGVGKITTINITPPSPQSDCKLLYSYKGPKGKIECLTELKCLEKGKIPYKIQGIGKCEATCPTKTHRIQNDKCVSIKGEDESLIPSSDTFEDLVINKEFFKELSEIKKDQLKPSFKEIAATAKEPSKLEITLSIGPALGKVLEKYLNYQEGTKVQIRSESKKFSSKYTKESIEKRMDSLITDFIVFLLEAELSKDQAKDLPEDPKKTLEKLLLEIIKPLLKNHKFFEYIKESIVGTIPKAVPKSFNPETLINYLLLKDAKASSLLKKPQELLKHLKTLITKDKFKVDKLPKSWISDKAITYKITYLGTALKTGTDPQVGPITGSDPQVVPQTKISCDEPKYYFEDQCLYESDCKKKGHLASIENRKNVCAPCPVDQGTHKLKNGVCVEEKKDYSANLVKIIESFGRELTEQYDPDKNSIGLNRANESSKASIRLQISDKSSSWSQKYFVFDKYYNPDEKRQTTITLDNLDEVIIPKDYTVSIVTQYVKDKVVEFLEKLLDDDPDTIQLVKNNPLLTKVVDKFFKLPEVAPEGFDSTTLFDSTKHNFWQAIYLTEVKSFTINGIEMIKPSIYSKTEMTPYLKALLKISDKWSVGYFRHSLSYRDYTDYKTYMIFYGTERVAECTDINSYFYKGQCIDKQTCESHGKIAYTSSKKKNKCGKCPAGSTKTHQIKDGECVEKKDCGINYLDENQDQCITKETCKALGQMTYRDNQGNNMCGPCPETYKKISEEECVVKVTECTGTEGYYDGEQCIDKLTCESQDDIYAYTDDQLKNHCGPCPEELENGNIDTHKIIDHECLLYATKDQEKEFLKRELKKQTNLFSNIVFRKETPENKPIKLQIILDNIVRKLDEIKNKHVAFGKKIKIGSINRATDGNSPGGLAPYELVVLLTQIIQESIGISETDVPLFQEIQKKILGPFPTKYPDEPFDPTKHKLYDFMILSSLNPPTNYNPETIKEYLKARVKNISYNLDNENLEYTGTKVENCSADHYHNAGSECLSQSECKTKGHLPYTDSAGKKQCGPCPPTHKETLGGKCALKVTECTGTEGYFYQEQCIDEVTCKTKGHFPYTDSAGKKQCGPCPPNKELEFGIEGTHNIVDGECLLFATEEQQNIGWIRELKKQKNLFSNIIFRKETLENEKIILNMIVTNWSGIRTKITKIRLKDFRLGKKMELNGIKLATGQAMPISTNEVISQLIKESIGIGKTNIPLFQEIQEKILGPFPTKYPDGPFDPTKHKLYDFMILSSLNPPTSYDHEFIKDYFKKQADNFRWNYFNRFKYTGEKTEKCSINRYLYAESECLSQSECKTKGSDIYAYRIINKDTKREEGQCGICPTKTHKIDNNQCMPFKIDIIPAFKELNLENPTKDLDTIVSWNDLRDKDTVSECPPMTTESDADLASKFQLTSTTQDDLSLLSSDDDGFRGLELKASHCLPQTKEDMEAVYPRYNELSNDKKLAYEKAFLQRKDKFLDLITTHIIEDRSNADLRNFSNLGDSVEGVLYKILKNKKLFIAAKVKMSEEEIKAELQKRLGDHFPSLDQKAQDLHNKGIGHKYFMLVIGKRSIFPLRYNFLSSIVFTKTSQLDYNNIKIYKDLKTDTENLSKDQIDQLTLDSLIGKIGKNVLFSPKNLILNELPKAKSLDDIKYRGLLLRAYWLDRAKKKNIILLLSLAYKLNQALFSNQGIYRDAKITYTYTYKMYHIDYKYNLITIANIIKEIFKVKDLDSQSIILVEDAEKEAAQGNLKDKVIIGLKNLGRQTGMKGAPFYYLYVGQMGGDEEN